MDKNELKNETIQSLNAYNSAKHNMYYMLNKVLKEIGKPIEFCIKDGEVSPCFDSISFDEYEIRTAEITKIWLDEDGYIRVNLYNEPYDEEITDVFLATEINAEYADILAYIVAYI